MHFTTKLNYTPLASAQYPVLVVPAFEGEPMARELMEVDKGWKGALGKFYKSDVVNKEGEISMMPGGNVKGVERVVFIGMGPRDKVTVDSIRRAAGKSANMLLKRDFLRIVYLSEAFVANEADSESAAYALLEGARLGSYSFDQFKSEKKDKKSFSAELHLAQGSKVLKAAGSMEKLLTLTTSTLLARDWDNTPSNLATPTDVARLAKNIAKESGIACEVLDQKDCEKAGMGSFLGVARGSNEPPKFIILDYKPKKYSKTFCMVGKALTFDSGGICIKPAAGMEEMKADKSGGIAVIATMRAVGLLKPEGVRIVGVIPATENMPSGTAIKPGDVVRTQSGKSIEVINTDAEGRLVLADGIEYAIDRFHPDLIVDIATLTGACVIALGTHVAGLWTEQDEVASLLYGISCRTGEKVWRMPLVKEYKERLKSEVADCKNVGGPEGGAITAALFLQQFAGDTPWVHLDIAGPAYTKEAGAYNSKGATGFGPRLLYSFIEEWSNARI